MRSFALNIGIAASTLSNIFSHKDKLSLLKAKSIVQKLPLSNEQKDQFIASVQLNHDGDNFPLIKKLENIIENPLHHAVLNTFQLDNFESNIQWISENLNCSNEEIKSIIFKLEETGLIDCKNKDWKRLYPKTISYDQVAPKAQRKFHQVMLEKAINSLDNSTSKERSITGITMSIDINQLEEANKEIYRFRERMSKLLEKGHKTKVYHLEISLFPF